MTVVPIKLYFNDKGLVKLTIALAKGKKKHDKRASIKDKEWVINKQRLIKNRSLLEYFYLLLFYNNYKPLWRELQ